MIRPYRYIETVHAKLHEYVLAYFRKIETDTNGFRDELFEVDFLPIVNRHEIILKNKFRIIYDHVNTLLEPERHIFCQQVIESNQIQKICKGEYKPNVIDRTATGINKTLRDLFLNLYNQVLDGDPFRETNKTTLRKHFDEFCEENKDITLCPICGISELKKSADECRDQYDHYLPKSLYPFSSVNFHNLVPCCKECNSFDAKGDKDTIAVSTGKFFFPYDENHKGIDLAVNVNHDDPDIEKIGWQLVFSNPDNKNEEIESWKAIYSIEKRHQGYIKARIRKWYEYYFGFIRSPKLTGLSISDRKKTCMLSFELNESLGLAFISRPTLEGLLSGSNIVQAEIEALEYA